MTNTQLDIVLQLEIKIKMTSDEYLYSISEKKKVSRYYSIIQEASVDALNSADNEPVRCAKFHSASEPFIFSPDIYTSSCIVRKLLNHRIKSDKTIDQLLIKLRKLHGQFLNLLIRVKNTLLIKLAYKALVLHPFMILIVIIISQKVRFR